ncbi:MAG: sugar ABC transporter substrate-binding protein [Treponema sp.]|nr:sugar ABC transporter substrate-binding protein [Treponema sp.]MBQ7166208.1 sugar ABC transporter substrate-binding protein [Treponema sp.]
MKKILGILLSLAVLGLSFTGCSKKDASAGSSSSSGSASSSSSASGSDSSGSAASTSSKKDGDITIGVSIWSSTDTLGSQCKRILDSAAKALGVKVMYVDQGHISEQVTGSAETLCAAGCDGIIICNSASAEMTSVINTCTKNKVYVAQFFRVISEQTNPNEFKLAKESPYYVGAVHEDEVENGKKLVTILANKGCRKIALEGWEAGDATFLLRWEGYKAGVKTWNLQNADKQVTLLEPQYGGTTSDTGRATAEAIINANPDIDALIVAGGGGDTLVGALAAIESMGRKGKIAVVSTDFLADLDEQLASGGMAAESGGHYCDPLIAFMLVYNAIKGNYSVPKDSFYDIPFPYLYVASSADYASYAQYFVDDLPYNEKELKEMAGLSVEDLAAATAKLSIEDVKSRR